MTWDDASSILDQLVGHVELLGDYFGIYFSEIGVAMGVGTESHEATVHHFDDLTPGERFCPAPWSERGAALDWASGQIDRERPAPLDEQREGVAIDVFVAVVERQHEPLDEDHPCEPDHPYSITKLAGEQILLSAERLRGVPVLSLRLGTAYGRGLRANSVFRLFIDRARRGDPITIQGDGSQSRQFTHTSDIARAFELASVSDVHGMALNVVAGESFSIKELAEMIVERYPTGVRFDAARPGDAPPALVSAQRAKETLGWEATTSFAKGLGDLLDDDEAGN